MITFRFAIQHLYYSMLSDNEKFLCPIQRSSTGESDPPPKWARPALAAAVLAFILTSVLIHSVAGRLPEHPTLRLWLSLLPVHGATLLAVFLVLRRQLPAGEKINALDLPASGLKELWRKMPRPFFIGLGIYIVAILISLATSAALLLLEYEPPPMPLVEILLDTPTPALVASIILAAVIIAPVSEEILFRVILFESLRPLGRRAAFTLTSAVFALTHGSPAHMPALFFLGLSLQAIRSKTENLWACILCHAMFNALTFLLMGIWLWDTYG